MSNIKREQLKNNFLKEIIIRLDFQNILENDIPKIISMIKNYVEQLGFDRYEERNTGNINVDIRKNDFGSPDVTSNITNKKKVYCFTDEIGYLLELTDSSVVVRYSSTKYIPFEKHFDIISNIVKIISDNSSFFTEKRFGVRKINKCLLKDKLLINKFFNPKVISFYDEDKNAMMCTRSDIFVNGNECINFNRSIIQGKSNNDILYQISLDIDAYIQEINAIKNTIYNQEEVLKLNNTIFDIFIGSLTEELKKNLINEEWNLTEIIGVEANE